MRVKIPEIRVVIVDFEIYRAGKPTRWQQLTCSYRTKTAHKLAADIRNYAKDNIPSFDVSSDSIRITNVMRLV